MQHRTLTAGKTEHGILQGVNDSRPRIRKDALWTWKCSDGKGGLITVSNRMDDLIKHVRTFRFAAALDERVRLSEEIFPLIEPDLRFFVFGAIRPPAAEDVLQEVLKAVATGMRKFAGGSNKEFWGWCYRIARNKLNNHFRAKATDREQPMPHDELWKLVEASGGSSSLSAEDRIDLE
jgi:hypothetical protein